MRSEEIQKLLSKCWTTRDLVARFRVSAMTIYLWRKRLGLPALELTSEGRSAVRFVPQEVRAWARAHEKRMHAMKGKRR